MRLQQILRNAVVVTLLLGVSAWAAGPEITVYKTATCGCCSLWAQHLEKNGFKVNMNAVPDMDVYKRKYGVPRRLESCHTGIVDDYVIEGHVPAGDILRLLKERPDAKGLAVPGMPLGSPGMESQRNEVRDAYDVLLFKEDGTTTVFHHYPGS